MTLGFNLSLELPENIKLKADNVLQVSEAALQLMPCLLFLAEKTMNLQQQF